jgi:hypothetical protein
LIDTLLKKNYAVYVLFSSKQTHFFSQTKVVEQKAGERNVHQQIA